MNNIRSAFVGWIVFNVVLLVAGFLAVRLLAIDLWPYQVNIATWLTGGRFINPAEFIPPNTRYVDVQLLDTDRDGEEERILFYRYDLTAGRSPLGAVVLDLDHCRPRRLESQELIPVDRDYLSEAQYLVELRDLPDVGTDRGEVLVWGLAGGIRTELAIFAWYDMTEPCKPPANNSLRGYLNLGSFRGSGGIQIAGNTIRVKDRAYERSQLAVTRVYQPQNASYRQTQNGPMLAPVARAVEFTFTPPTPAAQTYYPEKAVLTFYLTIGMNTAQARSLLDPTIVSQYISGNLGQNVAEPGEYTSMAEVKEIAYIPDVEKERLHAEIPVEVTVVNRRPNGTISGEHRYRVWVRGSPNPNASPYGCEWRIFKFEPLQ